MDFEVSSFGWFESFSNSESVSTVSGYVELENFCDSHIIGRCVRPRQACAFIKYSLRFCLDMSCVNIQGQTGDIK